MDLAQAYPLGLRLPRRDILAGIASALMVTTQDKKSRRGASSTGVDEADDATKNFQPSTESDPRLVRPKHLKKGDTVGIIAPGSPLLEPGELEFTFQWLKKLGLKYKLGKHLFDSYSEFAGSDEARLEDLHDMWADPVVKAVMPVRGGNGTVRLLPKLDFNLIAENPKIIMGFSDITGLIIPIYQQTGLVTFHGPMMASFFESAYTYHNFVKALMTPKPIGLVVDQASPSIWNPEYPPTRLVLAEGKARGRLVGGCMTVIRQLMGTPFEMQTDGRIVFLEDINEEPHEIDRVLYQLLLAGKLQKARAIVIGECRNCKPGGSGRNVFPLNLGLEQVLRDRLGELGIPVVYGMRFGHSKEKFTLPLGVMATLDATPGSVRFKIEESATV